jgi:hypothetical protein
MRVYWSYVRRMISPYGAGLHAGRYSKKLQRWIPPMFLPVINLTAFIQEPMAECSFASPSWSAAWKDTALLRVKCVRKNHGRSF